MVPIGRLYPAMDYTSPMFELSSHRVQQRRLRQLHHHIAIVRRTRQCGRIRHQKERVNSLYYMAIIFCVFAEKTSRRNCLYSNLQKKLKQNWLF
jgi:hypothetical protein